MYFWSMNKIIPFLFIIIFSNASYAQYFNTGQDPASIKWRQLHTAHFHLIFPDYYESQAQKLAGKLEEVYSYAGYTLKNNPEKISIILHTQTIHSNGLIAWAPKRAELFTIPHQSIYPQDWLEQLALHETRHVVQIDKVNKLLPGLLKMLFGEQVTALVFGGYLPWWVIEGDAVVTETSLSNYGRGRLPSFLMEHKAQCVEKGIFSYDKAYLGSYRDFVPDHYKLGYLLVGSTRVRYGSSIWEEALWRIGDKPLSLNPVNHTLKRMTGMNKVKLYNSVFDSLTTAWVNEDKIYQSGPFRIISPSPEKFTSYNYNHWINDSMLISYKTSFNTIPEFVRITKGSKTEKLLTPGNIFEESVNYRGDWIIYSEKISDIRWQHSGKSIIRMHNIVSNQKIDIVPEHTCFAPAVSPSLDKVAVIEADY